MFSDPLTNKAQYEKFMDYYSKLYLRNASNIPSFMSTIFHCDDLDAENVPRIKEEKSKQPAFINKMPTEILLDIFSQAIPSTTIDPFKATAGPWVLSKVCKKWNSIITTYAPLWTNITIDTSPKAMNVLKPYRCLLDVLKHSQDQPLSIRFVEGEDSMPSVTHMLLRILMKHAPRWKSLDFTLPTPTH